MRERVNVRLVASGVMVLTALSWPVVVAAQAPAARNELTVFAGVSLASPEQSTPVDPTILQSRGALTTIFPGIARTSVSLDGSAEFGARYGRYLSDALSISADFSIAPAHKLTERVDFGCPDLRLCILNLPTLPPPGFTLLAPNEFTTRVVAYHYGGNVNFDLLKGTLRPTVVAGLGAVTYDLESRTKTQFALRVGGGLRADTGPLVIRVELVDVIMADHFVTKQAEHDLHVRVGFGVKW